MVFFNSGFIFALPFVKGLCSNQHKPSKQVDRFAGDYW